MEPTHRLVFSLMKAFNDWNARLTAIEQRLARDDAAAAIQRGTIGDALRRQFAPRTDRDHSDFHYTEGDPDK
jgi:hypothetical protein